MHPGPILGSLTLVTGQEIPPCGITANGCETVNRWTFATGVEELVAPGPQRLHERSNFVLPAQALEIAFASISAALRSGELAISLDMTR